MLQSSLCTVLCTVPLAAESAHGHAVPDRAGASLLIKEEWRGKPRSRDLDRGAEYICMYVSYVNTLLRTYVYIQSNTGFW